VSAGVNGFDHSIRQRLSRTTRACRGTSQFFVPYRNQQDDEARYATRRPTVDELLATAGQFKKASSDFLKLDVATGLTFSKLALETDNPEKKQRNLRSARRAYDMVIRLLDRIPLSEEDAECLSQELAYLKANLERLGEVF
jgi:hypothetical protein